MLILIWKLIVSIIAVTSLAAAVYLGFKEQWAEACYFLILFSIYTRSDK